MKFKGNILETKSAVKNIISVYNQNNGRYNGQWYYIAHTFADELAQLSGLSIEQTSGIIAALSPLKSWDENRKLALSYVTKKKAGHTAKMVKKCHMICTTKDVSEIADILNGNKITSFFLNILYPDQETHVTIDRHAISIVLGYSVTDNFSTTNNQYEWFVNCYRIAAKKIGISPVTLQAITWDIWRSDKKNI